MKETPKGNHDRRRKFTDEKEKEIFGIWLKTGRTEQSLADEFDCSKTGIKAVLDRGIAKRQGAYNKQYGRDKQATG